MSAAQPWCWGRENGTKSKRCIYSFPWSTCCPCCRGSASQQLWCGHTGHLEKQFRLFWLTSRKNVKKVALPCITAAQTSGLFPLSLPSSANLQDSQLQVFQDQAFHKLPLTLLLAHLTNQLLHQPSPQLCHRDWNSETLSNETVRIDTTGKVTWVLADLGYTALLWGLIHGTVCVLSMHLLLPDLLLDRAQVWLLPSLGLSARMRCWRSFVVSWPP